ncbi:sigma-54-dependent Fis family transcriptional regulator [Priestia megaterium]|uniref:sigma-54-dependent Fis family transcriptional regulator n=1 Tax=Priestia megaterium TaxID=1404 RepID=UPI00336B80A8
MKVMAIAPYNGLKELMINLGEYEEFELKVEIGDLQEGVTLAKEALKKGIDVIISRGGTAELIQREVSIPVIEIEVSGYDMLRVLTLVKDYPGKTAIVGFSPISEGASTICEILDINMSSYKVREEEEIEPILIQLYQEGYMNIIGDAVTVKKAENLGLTGILLTSGKESVLKSFQYAKKVHQFISSLKKNYLISHNIIQEETEGVVVYDSTFQLVFSNPYFKEKLNGLLEQKLNLKEALNKALNTGIFKTIININNVFWKIKAYPLHDSEKKLVVFRIDKHISKENQDPEGISIISFPSELTLNNNIITKSESMNKVLKNATIYSDTEESIWISGEEGTGKERLAQFIHFNSVRREYPLLVMDCAMISKAKWDCLLDKDSHQGLISYNPNGSVFLKNIDALNFEVQKKLTNFLRECSNKYRFIVSSRKSVESLMKENFHQELYYLLASLTLVLPSLVERKEDIESLALLFIGELNIKFGKQIVGIRNNAKQELENIEWPGNINQLKQFIQESVLLADGPFLELTDIKKVMKDKSNISEINGIDLRGSLEEIERRIIKKVWLEEGMNQTKTAERLGINRTTLWRKLK